MSEPSSLTNDAGGPAVILIGPPGAGKTSVARVLSRLLDVPFRDTDADVEAVAQKSISDIFLSDGEPAFRELEAQAVRTAVSEHTGVLALGGGAVLAAETQAVLSGHRVVFLDVNLASAARRVGLDQARPLLMGNPRARWQELMNERRPVYEQTCLWRVDTSGRSVDDVAAEISQLILGADLSEPAPKESGDATE